VLGEFILKGIYCVFAWSQVVWLVKPVKQNLTPRKLDPKALILGAQIGAKRTLSKALIWRRGAGYAGRAWIGGAGEEPRSGEQEAWSSK